MPAALAGVSEPAASRAAKRATDTRALALTRPRSVTLTLVPPPTWPRSVGVLGPERHALDWGAKWAPVTSTCTLRTQCRPRFPPKTRCGCARSAPPEQPLPEHRYKSASSLVRALRELWGSRQMIRSLAEREMRARYKQTYLGIAWAVVTPFLLMVVFTLFFKQAANVDTGDVPYSLFAYLGLLPWSLFSTIRRPRRRQPRQQRLAAEQGVLPAGGVPAGQRLLGHRRHPDRLQRAHRALRRRGLHAQGHQRATSRCSSWSTSPSPSVSC